MDKKQKQYVWEAFPLVGMLDDNRTSFTETGEVNRLIHVDGKDYQGMSLEQIDALWLSRKSTFNYLPEGMAMQVHTHKYKVVNDLHQPDFSLQIPKNVSEKWNTRFTERFQTDHYISLTATTMNLVGSIANKVNQKEAGSNSKLNLLKDTEDNIFRSLHEYNPRLIKGDEVFGYWKWMLNGTKTNQAMHNYRLYDDLITSAEIFFPTKQSFMVYDERIFSSFVHLKIPNTYLSMQLIENILKLPVSVSIFQTYRPISKSRSLASLRDKRETMKKWSASNEIGFIELNEVESRLEADEIMLFDFSITIEVKSDSVDQLKKETELVQNAIDGSGFTPALERVNIEACYWSRFPSIDQLNSRTRQISNENASHFTPFSKIGEGLEQCSWGDYPITHFKTEKGSTYGFTCHLSPEPMAPGHTLIIGGTNSGKTTLISFLLSECFKYPNFKAIAFDRLRGLKVFTELCDGEYNDFSEGAGMSFNPLQLDNSTSDKIFLNNFIKMLSQKDDEANEALISKAIDSILCLPKEKRTLADLCLVLGLPKENSAAFALNKYLLGAERGHYFNAEVDSLNFDKPLCSFDMTQVLDEKDIVGPMAYYIFHRIFKTMQTQSNSGFAVFVDEFPRYLKSPAFVPYVEIILQELRKLDGVGIFACQDPQAVFDNEQIADKLKANIQTYLLYPDPQADKKYYQDILNLTDSEMEWIKTPHHRQVLCKRKTGESAILDIDLSSLGKYLKVFDSSKDSVNKLNSLKGKTDDWKEVFLNS